MSIKANRYSAIKVNNEYFVHQAIDIHHRCIPFNGNSN